MSRIFIGTSGWSYASWRGPFFPKNVMVKHHLDYYATQFSSTELNGVFYRTPTVEAVRGWRDNTPDDFIFAWKASKFITHWKRLTDKSRNSLALLESRLRILGPKAGPVLFQLPPQFIANRDRLTDFLGLLKADRRYVFEFRHPSWSYKDHYSNKTLRDWARKIVAWTRGLRDVYVYFDNDQKSAAPMGARLLMTLVDQRQDRR
jgi:uncharacterized protein YecE (DUF72 family)